MKLVRNSVVAFALVLSGLCLASAHVHALGEIQKPVTTFKCAGYPDRESKIADVKDHFHLGQTKKEIDSILVGQCGALEQVRSSAPDPLTGKYRRVVAYRESGIKNQSVVIEYQDDEVWEVKVGVTRVWPEEPPTFNAESVSEIASMEQIKAHPSLFRFEFFPSNRELAAAATELFAYGTPRSRVEEALVLGGRATATPGHRVDPATGRKFDAGKNYSYFLPAKDGRVHIGLKKNIMAVYDSEDRLVKLFLGNEIYLRKE